MQNALEYEVLSYDDVNDDFHLEITEVGFHCGVELNVEGDSMQLPSAVVACLVGEWGEPSEFIGKKIQFPLPK